MKPKTILLDGGMGRELQERGLIAVRSIWSAAALLDCPAVVQEVHEAFIAAGAEVITTNTYGAVRTFLGAEDMEDRFEEMIAAGVALARAARDAKKATNPAVRIAGSLPPLNISYRPDLVLPDDELARQYSELTRLLSPGVDLLLCETLACVREARAAARAAMASGLPVWVGLTLADSADGTLRSGEPLEAAVDGLKGLGIEGILLNCCSVEAIDLALPRLRQGWPGKVGAYANAFQPMKKDYVMGEGPQESGGIPLRDDLSIAAYRDHALAWQAAGADIIGGCCGIGPAHIAALSEAL